MTARARIGVVLSSGGGRGVYAHTGFLLALEHLGVTVDAGAGCSAGAVVGGVAASGTDLRRWAEAIANVRRRDFWTADSVMRLFWELIVRRGRGYTGLSSTDAAIAFCERHLRVRTFEECRYPFHTVAVSLGRGRKKIFSGGELAPKMMASAAMPLLYRPVEIDGDLYCDGAIIEMAPMDAICCKHDLDVVLIHHVARRFDERGEITRALQKPWAIAEIIDRLLLHQRPWYLSDQPLTFRRCPCGCGAVLMVFMPVMPELRWPLTEGGPEIQNAIRKQVTSLLQPHLRDLLTNPRRRLPVSSAGPWAAPEAPRCGGD